MQFSIDSRIISIKAQLDYIFEKVEHDRLLVTAQALDLEQKLLFFAPENKIAQDGSITLNVSLTATKFLQYEDGILSFEARFDGKIMQISLPTTLIINITALRDSVPCYVSEPYVPFKMVEVDEPETTPEKKKPSLSLVH